MNSQSEKQEVLDKRYLRMAQIWAENSYCELFSGTKVGKK